LVPQADFVHRVDFDPQEELADFAPQALVDSGRVAPACAPSHQPGEPLASQVFPVQDAHSHRGPLHRAGTSSLTVHSDFAASVTERSFTDALDASRRSSSAADYFWDRPSILITRFIRTIRITPVTTTDLRPSNRLS